MTQPPRNNALDDARNLINSIQEKLNQLYAVAPSLEGNDIIQEPLFRSHADFKQAAEKLAYPALRIATIGTTSAGKSTLVNGLIGRKIAPMDAAELSAGILHLVHNPQSRLQIKKPDKGGSWQGMDQSNWDDKSIYDHVRENVFKVYHKDKETQTISVPEVRIEGPLLPAAWTDLLKLPAGVGIEIYDLPGLNSIADKDNLKVIQDHLKQCFSLVVMNYSHTDSSNRSELLKQVKKVVEALGGKTDAMLFVLNGVNLRNETDDPLEQRLADFALAIQTELRLLETPTIMPINAQALFYAQCAWGYSDPTTGQPTTDAALQTELLKKFNNDCGKFTKQYQKKNADVKNWLRDIEDAIEENSSYLPAELITTENLQQWFKWSWEHSGGLALWSELRQRVNERFAEIVIAPTLIQPLNSLEVLLTTLDKYSETQRLSDKDAVEQKKQELQQNFEDLQGFLEQESQEFEEEIRQNIQSISSAMASGIKTDIDEAIDSLFGLDSTNPEAAEALRTIVKDIKIDLTDTLIVPVRDYYDEDYPISTEELKEALNKVLSPEPRDAITRAADLYRARRDVSINGYNGKARKGSDDEKKLKGIENAAHSLFKAMREGLTARASYTLQTYDHSMQQALDVLLERAIIDIENRIRQELPDNAEALLAIYRQKRANVEFNPLPDNIFALQDSKAEELSQSEKVGVEGSCFKSDIFEDIDYITLKLPNVNEMANMWMEGVNQAETLLWDAVGKWFAESASEQNRLFQQSLEEARTHLLGLLNQRLEQSESEYQRKLVEIEGLDAFCHGIKTDKENLRASGNTSGANNEPVQQ
jgi:GTPase SAR1 family protein